MSEGAQRRSIDEIIGSIRSIMDRGTEPAVNDDVPDELTDLPASPVHPVAHAEPVAPRAIEGDAVELPPFAHVATHDDADRARMAEIARTVTSNLPDEPTEVELNGVAQLDEGPIADPVAATVSPDLARAGRAFGRRGVPADELPVHDRLRDLNRTVASEHTVSMRGVTVQAANDPLPGEAAEAPAAAPSPVPFAPEAMAAFPQVALPVPLPAPAPHAAPSAAASDPVLDDATLRPIVREWLDDNLPPLVERLVREELQKAIRGTKG